MCVLWPYLVFELTKTRGLGVDRLAPFFHAKKQQAQPPSMNIMFHRPALDGFKRGRKLSPTAELACVLVARRSTHRTNVAGTEDKTP